jgi:hypothetical protein
MPIKARQQLIKNINKNNMLCAEEIQIHLTESIRNEFPEWGANEVQWQITNPETRHGQHHAEEMDHHPAVPR